VDAPYRQGVLRLVLLLALAAPTTTVPATTTVAGDRKPPIFAGALYAVTCLPGPVGGGRTIRFHLRWRPARDDTTRTARIVYDVYQATSPGGEKYSRPTYTTKPGATTFVTPPLPSAAGYYFVVRARDLAGNHDRNRAERQGENMCV
jgi:hypothetical protein